MKAVAVAYGGGHIQAIVPVVRELMKRGHDVALLAPTMAGPAAASAGIPNKAYLDYMSLVDESRAKHYGEKLAPSIHNPISGIPLAESVAYMGINYLENVDALGEELAQRIFSKVGRHSFLPVEFLKRVIEAESADVLVTTNSPKSEKAAIIAAERAGIPSIRIEDLFLEPHLALEIKEKLGIEDYEASIGRFALSPSRVCVMCEFSKLRFEENKGSLGMTVPLERVVVTGQPVFDEIDAMSGTQPGFDLVPGRTQHRTITWAHQNGTKDGERVLSMLAEWHRKYSDGYNFVVKVHPNMKPAEVGAISDRFDTARANFRMIHTDVNPNTVVLNSHVVMAQESTMLTQATYMKRQIVVLDPEGLRTERPYVVTGVARRAASAKDLVEIMKEYDSEAGGSGNALEERVARMGFRRSGSRNIVDLAEQLVRGD